MSDQITEALKDVPIVPLVTPDTTENAVNTTKALVAGGLKVIEVVLRTDDGMRCFGELIKALPDTLIGAGTVLTKAQAQQVIDLGAKFIVCPGLDADIVRLAQDKDIPIFPGIATATELQQAWNLGLRIVKFFPAGSAGGPKMIKDLSGPFRQIQFMPTGGVSTDNLSDYLAIPSVIACGGSWLTPKDKVAAGDFAAITKIAQDAIALTTS